jgi:hypothetical protein
MKSRSYNLLDILIGEFSMILVLQAVQTALTTSCHSRMGIKSGADIANGIAAILDTKELT